MATTIFSPCAGSVAVLTLCSTGTARPDGIMSIKVTDTGGAAYLFNLPVTQIDLAMQGNYQFLHTLDQFIYFYNFGDRISELTMSGFCFSSDASCAAVDASRKISGFFKFYSEKRQAQLKKPLKIQLDVAPPMYAFLTGARLGVAVNNLSTPLGQWSLRFHVIPAKAT